MDSRGGFALRTGPIRSLAGYRDANEVPFGIEHRMPTNPKLAESGRAIRPVSARQFARFITPRSSVPEATVL